MKRSKASWTTAVAASALLALPVGSWAQQTTPSTSPSPQTAGAPAPQAGRASGADAQKGSANEHLRQAQSALADIPAASLTGTAKTRVAELKRHLNTLEQSASKQASASGATGARNANWSTEVAAADRILSELLGATAATGATTPAPAGTSGSTATAPKTTTGGKPSASMTLDEPARAKLQEVRTHVTAFAAAMSGASASTPSSTPTATSASTDAPSTPASASAESTASAANPTAATATPMPTGTSGTTAAPATATATAAPSTTPSATAEPSAAATPSQSTTQPADATTPSPAPSQQVDADTVKRHLTSARDSLSQLTQLPAAAQLTGDARTQVSQLISNFNELITTNTDWRASYTKVQGNLTALLGDERASSAPSPAPATGTAGAVGTSGQVALDPAIRAKLIELRTNLTEFEKAAGGGSSTASAAQPSEPSASASSATASPAATASPSPASSTTSTPSSETTASASTASPAPTATAGSTAQAPTPAGTSGTGTPMPASAEQDTKPSTSARDANTPKAAEGHRAAMTHIEAIESILNGGSAPAGTSGTTAKPASAGTLDRAQIEQIRTHLSQLRRELSKSER